MSAEQELRELEEKLQRSSRSGVPPKDDLRQFLRLVRGSKNCKLDVCLAVANTEHPGL